jgi:hypothetical protein
MVKDPGTFFTSHQWVPVALGILISLTVHAGKAAVRPVVNATTVGVGTPIVSTAEDVGSFTLSLVAIVVPILVLVFLVAMIIGFWTLLRRQRSRRQRRRAARSFT